MATNITVNGTVYSVPAAGETGWASSVSTYLIAVGSAFLSKSGGSFTLTASANFGATYGLISKYFTSYSSNPSTTGVIRLANNEGIGFRNAANGADLILKVNASNVLEYNGNPITALALGTADYVLRMNAGGTATEYAKLVDANIASGAAIAVNKLAALTASKAMATDASGFASSATTTLTELNLLSGVTTPTGTGALVLANSPTLITPTVGAATATSINKVAITAPATSATLTLADGKTLTISNTLTFTGTDSSSVAFGTGGTVAYTANKLSAFAATTSAELAGVISDETGSGSLVFATSPSLTTPSLGAATATSINSTTIPSSKTLVVTTDKLSVHAATTSAELAGVISDETGSGALVFGTSPNITTPTGIVKGDVGLGNVDNTSDATKDAATATLTNKTLTSPTINTPTIDVATIDGQASAPSNPASGYYKTYVSDSDGKLHVRDSSGNDSAVGSGSSGRNYLGEWFDGVKSVGSVTSGITATGAITISTTAWQGSDTSKLTLANLTSGGLRETKSFKLDHIAVGAAFIQSPNFTLDLVDLGKPVMVSFDVGTVAASDDYQVVMVRYNSSGIYQEQIVIAGTASATTPFSARIPAGSVTSFNGFFIASSDSSDYYSLRFVRNSASDTTDVSIDSLKVSPEQVIQGAAVTDWVSFTPSGSNFPTFTSNFGWWRRSGDSMEVVIKWLVSGAGAAGTISITIPSSFTADSTKIDATGQGANCGSGFWYVNSGTDLVPINGVTDGTTGLYMVAQNAGNADTLDGNDFAASDQVTVRFTVPISGWSSSVTMANRAVEDYISTASVTSPTIVRGIAGALLPITTPTGTYEEGSLGAQPFSTTMQATDSFAIEINRGGTSQWLPLNAATGVEPLRYDGTNYIGIGVYYSSNAVYLFRGKYAAGTSSTWASVAANSTYRIRKVSGGASVGFPVSARNVVGDVSGTTVPSGYIGEKLSHIPAALTGSTSLTQWATITLTAGTWLVIGTATTDGSAGGTYIDLNINTTTASLSGTTFGLDRVFIGVNATSGTGSNSLVITKSVSSSTPIYLNGKTDHTAVSGIGVSLVTVRIA